MDLRGIVRAALLMAGAAVVAGAVGTAMAQMGAFTDARDGKKYKTTVIGGKKWMAQNLNYQTVSSWCCTDSSYGCCGEYGRLYNWSAAMEVCPDGWRLPSRQDWIDLGIAAGGTIGDYNYDTIDGGTIDIRGSLCIWGRAEKKLKAASGWSYSDYGDGNGTDDYGFSALPSGYRLADGSFYALLSSGKWWTSTQRDGEMAYYINMHSAYRYVYGDLEAKKIGLSVRCVADY